MKEFKAAAAVIFAAAVLTACGSDSPDTSVQAPPVIAENEDPATSSPERDNLISEEQRSETEAVPVVTETETAADTGTEMTETETEGEITEDTTDTDAEFAEDGPLKVFSDNMKTYCFMPEKSGSYTFKHIGNDDIPWEIYVLDEEFSDGMRYLYSNYNPDGVTEYTADIEAGKYVYLICTENEWNSSDFSDTGAEIYYNGENF